MTTTPATLPTAAARAGAVPAGRGASGPAAAGAAADVDAGLTPAGRWPRLAAVALTLAAVLAGAWLVHRAQRLGPGVYGDSIAYLSAADRLAGGRGLLWFDSEGAYRPLVHFPPAYPALLAVGEWAGVGARPWAAGANVLCFAGTVGLCGWLAWRSVVGAGRLDPDPDRAWLAAGAAGLASGAVATSLPLLTTQVAAMTEGPYLLLATLGAALLAGGLRRSPAERSAAAGALQCPCSARHAGRAGEDRGTEVPLPEDRQAPRSWTSRWRFALLAGAGLCWGLAVLFRYAGFYLIAVGVVAVALATPGVSASSWRRRLVGALAFGAAAMLPVGGWMVRNRLVAGTASSRHFGFTPPPASAYDDAVRTFGGWIFHDAADPPYGPTVALVAAFVLVPPAWWLANRLRRGGPLPEPARLALWLVAAAYLPFIWAARTFADGAVVFHTRTMAVVFPAVTVLVVAWLAGGLRRAMGRRPTLLRRAAAGFVAVSIAGTAAWASVGESARWAVESGEHGLGYAARRWQQSPTVAAVRALPPGTLIWTNAPDAVWALTGRVSTFPPRSYFRDSRRRNADRWTELRAVADAVTAARAEGRSGVYVHFRRVNRSAWLTGTEELQYYFDLAPLHGGGDGRVFDLVPKAKRGRS